MNKLLRKGIFIISVFVTMFVGTGILEWTILQSVQIVALMAIVMKLTDIEQSIDERK